VAQHDLARRQTTPPQRRPPVSRNRAVQRLEPADRDTDLADDRVDQAVEQRLLAGRWW
jgi:hypothetical protein